MALVEDVVNIFTSFTNTYTELKQRLCRAYSRSNMQKVNNLLDLPNLGSEKPLVLMDNILSLWPNSTTKNMSKLLLGLFLHRLPLQMRSQLANHPAASPAELAFAIDTIWSQSGGQVSTAAVTVTAVSSGCQLLAVTLPQRGWEPWPPGCGSQSRLWYWKEEVQSQLHTGLQ